MKTLKPGRFGSYTLLVLVALSNLLFFQNCENGNFDAPQVLNANDLNSQTPNSEEPQEKQCIHPDNGQAVSPGFAYYTFSTSSGATQSVCDAAKQTSYCDATTGTFIPSPKTHKSCLVAGQTCAYTTGSGNAIPTGNNEGSSVTGYSLSSATYPATCGQEVTRTCQANGNWNGSTPLFTSCTQKCVHPANSQSVDIGTTYTYYTRQSGTQAECNAAKVTSTCSPSGQLNPAVGSTRYAICEVEVEVIVKSAYSPIQAVHADVKVGTVDEPKDNPNPTTVGYIDGGDSLTFKNIDFENGAKSVTLNIALVKESTFDPNSKVEIREGSTTGTIIGNFIPQETGSWASFQDQSVNLTSPISGVKNLSLTFVGATGVLNIKSLVFSKTVLSENPTPGEHPTPPVAVKTYFRQDSLLKVPNTLFSIHAHRFPYNNENNTGVSPAPTYPYGGVRSHDHAKLIWAEVNPQKGVYNWSALDNWVNYYSSRNIKILYTVYGTPQWAAAVNGGSAYPSLPTLNAAPKNWSDLGDFVKAVLTRYNSGGVQKISFLETSNEPDLGWYRYGADGKSFLDFWIGSRLGNSTEDRNQRRADLARWHVTVYDAARSVDSSVKVLGPGFVWWQSTLPQGLVDFYNEKVDGVSVKDKADGFAFHSYQTKELDRSMIENSLLAKAAVTAFGKPTMPIYLTEIGFLRDGYLNDAVDHFNHNNMALSAQRWLGVAAGLGFEFVGLYSHDGGNLGPVKSPIISQKLSETYNKLAGKTIRTVAELIDGRIWIVFADGSTVLY